MGRSTHTASQLIDFNGLFLQDNLSKFVGATGVEDRKSVRVVSVLGPQSSGKSTLLNLLFGTNFSVMTAKTGPSQTTKGIWLAEAQKLEGVYVMDVEGTDSTERGGQALDYERKTALFSLALSEIVLVNLWSHDIGRQNAANLPLLKLVFEVNLLVFQEVDAPKTILLFVVRDHVASTTALNVLADRIMRDMQQIWESIPKPTHWSNAKVTDVFDFSFNSLAHFVLEPDNFEKDCNKLQERFYNHRSKDYLFRRSHPKSVVAGGFCDYTKNIWDTILENRNLDLPSQKQILSLHRCTDTLNQAYTTFCEDWRALLTMAKDGKRVPKFEEECSNMVSRATALYDAVTQGYHPEVREAKGNELADKISVDLGKLVDAQLDNVRRDMSEQFRAKFREFQDAIAKQELSSNDASGNNDESEDALNNNSNDNSNNKSNCDDVDPTDAINAAKERALSVGPDTRALSSGSIHPLVRLACHDRYSQSRHRFLTEVQGECLDAVVQHTKSRERAAFARAEAASRREQRARAEAERNLTRIRSERDSLKSAVDEEKRRRKAEVDEMRAEVEAMRERARIAEDEANSAKRRAREAEERAEEAERGRADDAEKAKREAENIEELLKSAKRELHAKEAEFDRERDEWESSRKMSESERKAVREELEAARKKASEAEARARSAAEEGDADRRRREDVERRMKDVEDTCTAQAKGIVALSEEKESMRDALERKVQFLTSKAEESQETLAYYEKIIAGNREEMMDLREKLAAAADYGEASGLNLRKAGQELEDLKHRNTDLFNENQYLIQMLNQKQSEFYEEYRRSLHERQLMAARLDDMERRSTMGSAPGYYTAAPVMVDDGSAAGGYRTETRDARDSRRRSTRSGAKASSKQDLD